MAIPVVIIGGGPSGLFAAVQLALHGIGARVIEHEPEPHHEARATALQPGTLEILAQAGVLDEVLRSSVHVHRTRVLDTYLATVGETSFGGVDCDWDYQCSLPQWRTEQILTARLEELGGTVERGVTALSVHPRDQVVLVELALQDSSVETIAAQYVIGAGGAHSITRASMNAQLGGLSYPGLALAADVQISCSLPRDTSALIASEAGYVFLAPLPGERWITFVGDLDPDEAEQFTEQFTRDASMESVAAGIRRRVPEAIELTDVAWASPFHMQRRMVPKLADQRRFLIGDAGHLSSPFGGEGLNSGLHDAHNLAWKLALELAGRARPVLLDSFAAERQSADQHVLVTSDRLHELAYSAVDRARTGAAATPLSPEQSEALTTSRALLDVSYAGSPLTAAGDAGAGGAVAGVRPGDRYRDRAALSPTTHHLLVHGPADEAALDQLAQRWQGLVTATSSANSTAAGLLLVRPDGHVSFASPRADATAFTAVDTHLSTYLIPG